MNRKDKQRLRLNKKSKKQQQRERNLHSKMQREAVNKTPEELLQGFFTYSSGFDLYRDRK